MVERKLFNPKNHKTTKGCIEDSLIIAGFSFFSGLIAAQGFSYGTLYGSLIAAGLAFFAQMAYEKKIKKAK